MKGRRYSRRLAYLLAFALTFPIFVHVGPDGLGPGQRFLTAERTPGLDFPLSVFLVPPLFFLGWWILRRRVDWDRLVDGGLVLFILTNVTAYLVGVLRVGGFGGGLSLDAAIGFAFLGQTLLPLAAFYLARMRPRDHPKALLANLTWSRHVLVHASRFALASLVLLVIQSLLVGGLEGEEGLRMVDYIGPIAITKIKRYYPTILAAAGAASLARVYFGRSGAIGRGVGLLAAAFVGACLPFIWSRSAVLTFLLAGVVLTLLAVDWRRLLVRHGRLVVGMLLGMVLVVGGMALAATDAIVVRRFERMVDPTVETVGDVRRVRANVEALREGVASPLGKMYVPRMERTLSGREYDFARIGMPENAYLDYAQKAGPVAMLTFLGVVLIVLFRGATVIYRRHDLGPAWHVEWLWLHHWIWAVIAALTAWSNFTQLNFTEPYTAMLFWYMLGTLLQLNRLGARELVLRRARLTSPGPPRTRVRSAGRRLPVSSPDGAAR